MTENEAIERFQKCVENNGKCECCKFYVNCGIYEMEELAIQALEEVQQYRQIGTVEEFREAVEKQTAKKPSQDSLDGLHYFPTCPSCGYGLDEEERESYCVCGQKLDWRANDENTD